MSESEDIDFSKYEWQAVQSIWTSLFYSFMSFMGNFMEVANMFPPAGYQVKYDVSSLSRWTASYQLILSEIAKGIGIDDETSYLRLRWHWIKIRGYNNTVSAISFPVGLLTGIAAFVLWVSGFEAVFGFLPDNPVAEFGFIAVGFILIWILLQTSKRLLRWLINQRYADTLATVGALYFMIELLRKDAMQWTPSRRQLQSRLHLLSQHIMTLAAQFRSQSPEEQAWIDLHFKSMERFVLDHERLIAAPKADSLNTLRRDFYQLLKILISGRYGEFKYDFQPPNVPVQTRGNKVVGTILGFIGFVIPALILYGLYVNPQRIAAIGVDVNTVALIALAWFLLTIDATLKLGIVERITGLAKTIRDLK